MFMAWRRTAVGLTVTVALVGGGGVAASAAPASPTTAATTTATRNFVGFGVGRSAAIALRGARTSALNKAVAAGYSKSQCVIGVEGVDERTVNTEPSGIWDADSELNCTN